MDEVEFELLGRIDERHWWFVGKRRLLQALLGLGGGGRRLLDLGCGAGGILRSLPGTTRCFGLDRSEIALRVCRDKGLERVARGDLAAPPFAPHSFDTVLILDVIEHVDDEQPLLEGARRLCAPGGRVVVAVPAFQQLWSKQDETLRHRRRYSSAQLCRVVRAAGLVPERTTYTNFLIFPVAALWRIGTSRLGLARFAPRTDFWPVPRWLNALLAALYRAEAFLVSRFRLPFGVSVVCIARNPG